MNKEDFIYQHGIKNALPIDPSKRALPAEGFAIALTDFLSERFRGAARIECDSVSAGAILISAEYAAYFFKILLTDLYARQMLTVKISSDEKNLIIYVGADEPLLLTEGEWRDLIRLARNSGFEIYPEELGFRLTAGLSPAMIHRVYAVSVVDARRVILGKLSEIFFCGEPLEDTECVDPLLIAWKEQKRSKQRSKRG